MPQVVQELRQLWGGEEPLPLPSLHPHNKVLCDHKTCRPWGWQDPAPLKTLLFILVPLSPEEEPRAAWGT